MTAPIYFFSKVRGVSCPECESESGSQSERQIPGSKNSRTWIWEEGWRLNTQCVQFHVAPVFSVQLLALISAIP